MYIFCAYKPDSTDYCKGCRMASYSSDHAIENNLTKDELVELWSEYLLKNQTLDCGEEGYEFWVFKDGVKVYDQGLFWSEGPEDQEEQQAIVFKETQEIYNQALLRTAGKIATKNEKAKQEAEFKRQEQELNEKAARLQMYSNLKKEFGG